MPNRGSLVAILLLVAPLMSAVAAPAPPTPSISITYFPSSYLASNLISGPDGAIWFNGGTVISRLSLSGQVTQFTLPVLGSTPLGRLPIGITIGPDGNIWATLGVGDAIIRMTPSGGATVFKVPKPANQPAAAPVDITVGPDGALWFTELVGKIGRITTSGVLKEFTVPTPNAEPLSITAGPDGNLWFTESNANKIGRITPQGIFKEFPIRTPNSGPLKIIKGSDNNLWFTEINGRKIGRITPKGVLTEFKLPVSSQPFGITRGPDGNLWFTCGITIGRITPKGVITEFPATTWMGITAGPDGNIWAAGWAGFLRVNLRNATGSNMEDDFDVEMESGESSDTENRVPPLVSQFSDDGP